MTIERKMPMMVTCQNCGYPFPSTVLQMGEDVFKAGKWKKQNDDEGKKYSETCLKCKKPFEYYSDNFFWKDLGAR